MPGTVLSTLFDVGTISRSSPTGQQLVTIKKKQASHCENKNLMHTSLLKLIALPVFLQVQEKKIIFLKIMF